MAAARVASTWLPAVLLLVLRVAAHDFGKSDDEVSWGSVVEDEKERAGGAPTAKEPQKVLPWRCPASSYRAAPVVWPCSGAGGKEAGVGAQFSFIPDGPYLAIQVPAGVKDLELVAWNDAGLELQVGTPEQPLLVGIGGHVNQAKTKDVLPGLGVTAHYGGVVGRENVELTGVLASPVQIAWVDKADTRKAVRGAVVVRYDEIRQCAADALPLGCKPYSKQYAQAEVERWACSGSWTADDAWTVLGVLHSEALDGQFVIPWHMFGPMWHSFSAETPATMDDWMFAFKFLDSDASSVVSEDEFRGAFNLCSRSGDLSQLPSVVKILFIVFVLIMALSLVGLCLFSLSVTYYDMTVAGTAPEGTRLPTWAGARKPLVKTREDVEAALRGAHVEAGEKYTSAQVKPLVDRTIYKPPERQACGSTSWISDMFPCGKGRGNKDATAAAEAAAAAPQHEPQRSYQAPTEDDPLLLHEESRDESPPSPMTRALPPVAAGGLAVLGGSLYEKHVEERVVAPAPPVPNGPSEQLYTLYVQLNNGKTDPECAHAAEGICKILQMHMPEPPVRSPLLLSLVTVLGQRPNYSILQEYGLRSLAILSNDPSESDERWSREAINAGVVSTIFNAAQAHKHDDKVPEAAFLVMKELGYSSHGRSAILHAGLVGTIVDLMHEHINLESLQEHACNTLGNLCVSEDAGKYINLSAVNAVVDAMQRHHGHQNLQEAGICALYNIDYAMQDGSVAASNSVRQAVQKAVEQFPALHDLEEAQALLSAE